MTAGTARQGEGSARRAKERRRTKRAEDELLLAALLCERDQGRIVATDDELITASLRRSYASSVGVAGVAPAAAGFYPESAVRPDLARVNVTGKRLDKPELANSLCYVEPEASAPAAWLADHMLRSKSNSLYDMVAATTRARGFGLAHRPVDELSGALKSVLGLLAAVADLLLVQGFEAGAGSLLDPVLATVHALTHYGSLGRDSRGDLDHVLEVMNSFGDRIRLSVRGTFRFDDKGTHRRRGAVAAVPPVAEPGRRVSRRATSQATRRYSKLVQETGRNALLGTGSVRRVAAGRLSKMAYLTSTRAPAAASAAQSTSPTVPAATTASTTPPSCSPLPLHLREQPRGRTAGGRPSASARRRERRWRSARRSSASDRCSTETHLYTMNIYRTSAARPSSEEDKAPRDATATRGAAQDAGGQLIAAGPATNGTVPSRLSDGEVGGATTGGQTPTHTVGRAAAEHGVLWEEPTSCGDDHQVSAPAPPWGAMAATTARASEAAPRRLRHDEDRGASVDGLLNARSTDACELDVGHEALSEEGGDLHQVSQQHEIAPSEGGDAHAAGHDALEVGGGDDHHVLVREHFGLVQHEAPLAEGEQFESDLARLEEGGDDHRVSESAPAASAAPVAGADGYGATAARGESGALYVTAEGVSLPEEGARPVNLRDIDGEAGDVILSTIQLLVDDFDASKADEVRPLHMVLRREYGPLLRRLFGANMVSFTRDVRAATLGFFSIPQGRKIRLICDAQSFNAGLPFVPPTRLTRVEAIMALPPWVRSVALSDLSRFFHRLKAPAALANLLRLPRVRVADLLAAGIPAGSLPTGAKPWQFVQPVHETLAMGLAISPWAAQAVHQALVVRALQAADFVVFLVGDIDIPLVAVLGGRDVIVVFCYLDDVGYFGYNDEVTGRAMAAVAEAYDAVPGDLLRNASKDVAPSGEADVLGFHVKLWGRRRFGLQERRVTALQEEIRQLLAQRFVNPFEVAAVAGRLSYAGLAYRGSYSLWGEAVFAFIGVFVGATSSAASQRARALRRDARLNGGISLWPRARLELLRAAEVLPYCYTDLPTDRPYDLLATDACASDAFSGWAVVRAQPVPFNELVQTAMAAAAPRVFNWPWASAPSAGRHPGRWLLPAAVDSTSAGARFRHLASGALGSAPCTEVARFEFGAATVGVRSSIRTPGTGGGILRVDNSVVIGAMGGGRARGSAREPARLLFGQLTACRVERDEGPPMLAVAVPSAKQEADYFSRHPRGTGPVPCWFR